MYWQKINSQCRVYKETAGERISSTQKCAGGPYPFSAKSHSNKFVGSELTQSTPHNEESCHAFAGTQAMIRGTVPLFYQLAGNTCYVYNEGTSSGQCGAKCWKTNGLMYDKKKVSNLTLQAQACVSGCAGSCSYDNEIYRCSTDTGKHYYDYPYCVSNCSGTCWKDGKTPVISCSTGGTYKYYASNTGSNYVLAEEGQNQMTETECEDYYNRHKDMYNAYAFDYNDSENPPGCFELGGDLYYNHALSNTPCGTNDTKCIKNMDESHANKLVGSGLGNKGWLNKADCYDYALEKGAAYFQKSGSYCYAYGEGVGSGRCGSQCWKTNAINECGNHCFKVTKSRKLNAGNCGTNCFKRVPGCCHQFKRRQNVLFPAVPSTHHQVEPR